MRVDENTTTKDLSTLKRESLRKIAADFRHAVANGTILKLVGDNWVDVNGNIVKKA
jgi:hypothetical protein